MIYIYIVINKPYSYVSFNIRHPLTFKAVTSPGQVSRSAIDVLPRLFEGSLG